MSAISTCVIREVAPRDFQYVPVNEVPALNPGETVYTGEFSSHKERLGPHGSHERTICLPVGKPLAEVKARVATPTDCVLREIAASDFQLVPVGELPAINRGEKLIVGSFRGETVHVGPSKSHERTICFPSGRVQEFAAA